MTNNEARERHRLVVLALCDERVAASHTRAEIERLPTDSLRRIVAACAAADGLNRAGGGSRTRRETRRSPTSRPATPVSSGSVLRATADVLDRHPEDEARAASENLRMAVDQPQGTSPCGGVVPNAEQDLALHLARANMSMLECKIDNSKNWAIHMLLCETSDTIRSYLSREHLKRLHVDTLRFLGRFAEQEVSNRKWCKKNGQHFEPSYDLRFHCAQIRRLLDEQDAGDDSTTSTTAPAQSSSGGQSYDDKWNAANS